MGLFEHWPYANFHELNLDWIISKVKQIDDLHIQPEEIAQDAAEAKAAAESAAQSAAQAQAAFQPTVDNMALLNARMDSLIDSVTGNPGDVELWTGDAYLAGTVMNLSEPVANFEYLDFYFKVVTEGQAQNEYVSIKRVNAESGDLNTFSFFNIADDISTRNVNDYEMEIATADTYVTIVGNRWWAWSGAAEDNSIKFNAAYTDTNKFVCFKVVGRRQVADPEVTDIRVAADGTIYPTAGDAVRQQIIDLNERIDQGVDGIPYAVKNAIDTILQNVGFKNDAGYESELGVIHAWASSVNLVSITAAYTPTVQICPDDSIEDLRNDLIVTADYDNGQHIPVTDYTLSGDLELGTSIITVGYEGKATTFNVTVTDPLYGFEVGTHTFTTPAHVVSSEDGNVITVNHIASSTSIQANISKVSDNTENANTTANYEAAAAFLEIPAGAHVKCVFIPLEVVYSSAGMGGKPFNVTFQKVTGGSDIPTGMAFMHNTNMNALIVGTPVIEEYTLTEAVNVGCFGIWMSSSSSSTATVKGRLKLYVDNERWI